MNIRPRCREWLPLSTQQLRLRNLQAIQGVNIELYSVSSSTSSHCSTTVSTETLLYYTLHDHPENEPFYTSEKVALRKHLHQKWAEIQCSEILKSNANCVCIKIWAWIKKTERLEQEKTKPPKCAIRRAKYIKEPISALTREFSKSQLRHQDKLLFSWGIYFSGLIPLSQNIETKCEKNSLIFQMNDEYFASPEHFTTENLREQLALNYERYSASVPKCSIPTPDEFTINSPQVSRSSSPVALDWQKDLLRMSKTRYTQLNCVRSEVKTSYDLVKLLRLQQLQRQRRQTQSDSVEMTADIKRLSLRCITTEQLIRKPRTTSINSTSTASQHHSMGRTLSLLLAEQQQINPEQLLHAQKLQQQLESLKSKQRLLKSAKETFSIRITALRQQLHDSRHSRQELQTCLSSRRRKLQNDKLNLDESSILRLERRQRRRSVTQHVERIMSSLSLELKDIYPISRNNYGFYTICGVPFPTMEGYIFDSNNANSVFISGNITPMALSASLGYVAHLVEMISVVINRPLRNPIIHEGSRTRIMDTIKDIPPYTSREFPLYSRASIPTKPVKYAVHLLNQNIAQLCYDITGIRCDIRATIDNLLQIFATFIEIEQNKREIHSHIRTLPTKRLTITEINNSNETDGTPHPDNHLHHSQTSTKNGDKDYSLSKSHSSVDMNHMLPPPTMMMHHNVPAFALTSEKFLLASRVSSHPIDIQDRSLITNNQQRNCRSVGSYTDSEEDVCHSITIQCFSNSESNLTSLQSDHHI